MYDFWKDRANDYARATDLETKVRDFFASTCFEKVKQGGKILELGSGNGAVLQLIEKLNKNFEIIGVDSSPEMNAVARSRLSERIDIRTEDLMGFLERNTAFDTKTNKYDAILICNTLHNLKSRSEMRKAIQLSSELLTPGGLLIVDIRNSFNIFVARGYRENRSRGLQFFTVTPFWLKGTVKKAALEIAKTKSIYYSTIEEAGKKNAKLFYRICYKLYLLATRVWIFSPYYVVVLKRGRD